MKWQKAEKTSTQDVFVYVVFGLLVSSTLTYVTPNEIELFFIKPVSVLMKFLHKKVQKLEKKLKGI